MKNLLFTHIKLFDGIEYSHFSFFGVKRYNEQARLVAEKYNKQFIGTGDIHNLRFLGKTYSSFEKKVHTIEEFIHALKTEKITIHTRDLRPYEVIDAIRFHIWGKYKKRFYKFKNKIKRSIRRMLLRN